MESSISTPIDIPLSDARLIALDRDAVAYVCGRDFTGTDQFAAGEDTVSCQAWGANGTMVWNLAVPLPAGAGGPPPISGGALANKTLFVSTGSGTLFAIGE